MDVARRMSVSKPSVTNAVSALRSTGHLEMDEEHYLHLTTSDRELAEKIYEQHQLFRNQLIAVAVTPERAACKIKHVISDESFQKLRNAISSK